MHWISGGHPMSLSTIISLSYRRQIPPFTSTEHFRLDPSSGSYRLKHREQLLRMCLFRIILRCISIASNLPHPHVRTKISSRQNRVCVCVSLKGLSIKMCTYWQIIFIVWPAHCWKRTQSRPQTTQPSMIEHLRMDRHPHVCVRLAG